MVELKSRDKAIKQLEAAIVALKEIEDEVEECDVVLDMLGELVANLKREGEAR